VGYYVRILSPSAEPVSPRVLKTALTESFQGWKLLGVQGEGEDWTQLILSHDDGSPITCIERSPVEGEGSLGTEEIAEFVDEVAECEPASAVAWLCEYFQRVKTVYAFQVLDGTYEGQGWDLLDCVRVAVRGVAGGIFQADYEGFSNEEGYHILWQFAEDVEGPLAAAVLQDGAWVTYEMDLANQDHRKAFKAGTVPQGVTAEGGA